MKNKPKVSDCKIVKLDTFDSGKGIITDFNYFDLKRVYYLYDVPSGVSRGSHAHKSSSQFIIAACGSFTIIINDGEAEKKFLLNTPDEGLMVVPGIWRELIDFSEETVCLVLSPETYDEKGVIRNFDEFVKSKED